MSSALPEEEIRAIEDRVRRRQEWRHAQRFKVSYRKTRYGWSGAIIKDDDVFWTCPHDHRHQNCTASDDTAKLFAYMHIDAMTNAAVPE